MKSLRESLFDDDLVTKEVGYTLRDDIILRRTSVRRERAMTAFVLKSNNSLVAIDWSKVNKDVKEYGGSNISFGSYQKSDRHQGDYMVTADTTKKTEAFARLILSMPCIEKCVFDGRYNSRFRDEFEEKLNGYIRDKWKDKFKFEIGAYETGLTVELKQKEIDWTYAVAWDFDVK